MYLLLFFLFFFRRGDEGREAYWSVWRNGRVHAAAGTRAGGFDTRFCFFTFCFWVFLPLLLEVGGCGFRIGNEVLFAHK